MSFLRALGGQKTEATRIVFPCDLELEMGFPMGSEEPGALTDLLLGERA